MEKILVIDDEIKILRILTEFLTLKGYRVFSAQSGRDGIKVFKEELPSLVIVDIIMPGIDGIEVLNEIRKISSNTEIIMITSYEDRDLAIKSLHFEASDFITKPINPKELYISIKRATQKLIMKRTLKEYTHNLEKLVQERTKRALKLEKQAIIGSFTQAVIRNIQDPLSVITMRSEFLLGKLKERTSKSGAFPVYGPIERMKKSQFKIEKNIRDIEIILKNARSIIGIIKNIMMKSLQDQNGKEGLIDVNEMIRQEIMFFDQEYFQHRIEKRYHLDPGIEKVCMVYCDLSQIFDNLIKSAVDAMEGFPRKRLTINVFQIEHYVCVEFTHTGSGSNPFFFSEKKPTGSTGDESARSGGMGLFTSLSLIKKYGGDIEVKNTLSEGATFLVKIPKLRTYP